MTSLLGLRVLLVVMLHSDLTAADIAAESGALRRTGRLQAVLTDLCDRGLLVRWLDTSVYPARYRYSKGSK